MGGAAISAQGLQVQTLKPWVGLKETGDPYAVLPKLSAERVRRATQITNDLVLDLQSGDIGIEQKESPHCLERWMISIAGWLYC